MSPRPFARFLFAALLAAPAMVAIAGCPIYSADRCEDDPVCRNKMLDGGTTADVDPGEGCGSGCSAGYVCTSQSTGRFECVPYDCRATEKACTAPQTCNKDESKGVWSCGSASATDCSTTGCISGYACKDVSGKKLCVSTDPNACVLDSECTSKTGAGSLCLGGVCKAPKDLCSDSTQCNAGSSCVDGRCVTKCASTCVAGYTCNATTGLCTDGTGACGATKACATGSTCVGDRCVAPAKTDGTCPAGTVSVEGGCVLDDRPIFFCDNDGTKDGTQDKCAGGSICLHHNCYISCTGASDTTTCAKADKFPICKSVTTSSGAHFVCGSNTSLGSECDPTATPPKACNVGKVCIDGFCK
jgi:hypothetical protein